MKEKFKIIGIIALAAIFALSMISCDEPAWDCEVDGHDFDAWVTVTEPSVGNAGIVDGKKERICKECSEDESEVIPGTTLFVGKWAEGGFVVEISANGDFSLTRTSDSANWTLKGASWTKQATTTLHTATATAFPFGYALANGTVGGSAGNPWAANTVGTAGVYINSTKDKIIVRLTGGYPPGSDNSATNEPRKFSKQP